MKRLELSVAADADLFDILAYGTAIYGEAAGDAYYLGLTDVFDFLCGNPAAGYADQGDEGAEGKVGGGGVLVLVSRK